MSTRRDLLAGFGVAIGAAALPISTEFYHGMTPPKVAYEFGPPGHDVAAELPRGSTSASLAPTQFQTQGPFFTYKSPQRRDIRDADAGGSMLVVRGYVLDTSGAPQAGYVLDFWQTDATARYDGAGYRYRGHQFTDSQGRYELITISPRPYTSGGVWRTAHLHAKVQGPGTPILTTQLYLPELADLNAVDPIYHPSLLLTESGTEGVANFARFDFVLAET